MNFVKAGVLLLLLFSSGARAAEISVIPVPAGPHSSLSRVITDNRDRVYLSWVNTEEGVSALYFSTLQGSDAEWTDPELIASGDDWFVNWADFPFFVANETTMAAHWLQKSSEGTYDYDVVASFRTPETDRWSKGEIIHSDGVSAEHGFVSMLPMSEERTFISWLDGRNTAASHQGHSGDSHGSGGMTLRAGIFDVSGAVINEWELDALTCDCCQTGAAMTSRGPVVVYRDRSIDEIRDIYMTRLNNGSWTPPVRVFEDDWQINGCPVNGPSVAARGEHLAVAGFSAKDQIPIVSLKISTDAGASFSDRIIVARENNIGRVSTAILDSGNVVVSWLQTEGASARLRLSLFNRDGQLISASTVANTKSSRRSGFPVIAARGEDIFVTWTDLGEHPQVRVARVRF